MLKKYYYNIHYHNIVMITVDLLTIDINKIKNKINIFH